MKLPLTKLVGFLFFIIFALQITDVTCYGKDLSKIPGLQGKYQFNAIDFNNKDITDFSSNILDHCQCPCHLSFYIVPCASIISCLLTDAPLNIGGHFSIHKISTDIFQPPKISL